MALSQLSRDLLGTALARKAVANEIADAIDNVALGNAANATVTNLAVTNISVAASGIVALANLTNFSLGTGSGTRIGTAPNQKLGLFAVTPVIQPASTGEIVGGGGNGATNANTVNATFNGNLGNTAYTINDIVKGLKQLGALAQ